MSHQLRAALRDLREIQRRGCRFSRSHARSASGHLWRYLRANAAEDVCPTCGEITTAGHPDGLCDDCLSPEGVRS